MDELRDIKGYEGLYAVTKDGRIWSYPKGSKNVHGLWLKPSKIGNTNMKDNMYYGVLLTKDKKQVCRRVHRLVAQAWIPNPHNKKFINHKDGNKLNNHIDNLEWVTSKENNQHAIKTGLKKLVRKNGDVWAVNSGGYKRYMTKEDDEIRIIRVDEHEKYGLPPHKPKKRGLKEGTIRKRSSGWWIKENGKMRKIVLRDYAKYGLKSDRRAVGTDGKRERKDGEIWQGSKGWHILENGIIRRIKKSEYDTYGIVKSGGSIHRHEGDVWFYESSGSWMTLQDGRIRRVKKGEYEKYGIDAKGAFRKPERRNGEG
jgi:hypothetical protein